MHWLIIISIIKNTNLLDSLIFVVDSSRKCNYEIVGYNVVVVMQSGCLVSWFVVIISLLIARHGLGLKWFWSIAYLGHTG